MTLSTAQRTALAGLLRPAGTFQRTATIILPDATEVDVSARVATYGKLRLLLANHAPHRSSKIVFPTVTLTLSNAGAYFGEATPGNVWSGYKPTACSLRIEIDETVSAASPQPILAIEWPISDLRLEADRVSITAAHPLRAHWSQEWTDDDRLPMNFTNPITGPVLP